MVEWWLSFPEPYRVFAAVFTIVNVAFAGFAAIHVTELAAHQTDARKRSARQFLIFTALMPVTFIFWPALIAVGFVIVVVSMIRTAVNG